MELELLKPKLENILEKRLFIHDNIITDENNSFEIIFNQDNGFDVNNANCNNHFNDIFELVNAFSKLNSEDQDEVYKACVDLLGYDKRLKSKEGKLELINQNKYLHLLQNDEDVNVRNACYKEINKNKNINRYINYLKEKFNNLVDWTLFVNELSYDNNLFKFIDLLEQSNFNIIETRTSNDCLYFDILPKGTSGHFACFHCKFDDQNGKLLNVKQNGDEYCTYENINNIIFNKSDKELSKFLNITYGFDEFLNEIQNDKIIIAEVDIFNDCYNPLELID